MLVRLVAVVLLVLLSASAFQLAFNVKLVRADNPSSWPMFGHDPAHSGYSSSTGPTTNQTLWSYKTGGWVECSPTVANGTVYVGSEDGKVYALNALTGALVRKYQTVFYGLSSSPAIVNNILYVGAGGDVYALNATTGALMWLYQTGGTVQSSPDVANGIVYVGSGDESISPSVANGMVYFGTENDNVCALNATTGALVWKYNPADANGTVLPAPLNMLFNVYAMNALTGALMWNYTTGNYVFSSPAIANGIVYAGSLDNNVYALNAVTGVLVWKYPTSYAVSSSPAVANGVVHIGSGGDVYALNATTGALMWNSATSSGPSNEVYSPAVAGGVVYVGSWDGHVYALNATTGAAVWKYETGGSVDSSPTVTNGVVYVGSWDDKVYAFGPAGHPVLFVVALAIVVAAISFFVAVAMKRERKRPTPDTAQPLPGNGLKES